jgi:hypothetical protein
MKKTLSYIVSCVCILRVMSACDKVSCDPPGPYPDKEIYFKSYIKEFIKCDSLKLFSHSGYVLDKENKLYTHGVDETSLEGIIIAVSGRTPAKRNYPANLFYDVDIINSAGLLPNGSTPDPYDLDRKTGYKKLTKEVGDTAYNRKIEYDKRLPLVVTISPVKKVIITADKSFGANFQSGTDLSSFFSIIFDDAYATIKNNYVQAPGTYRYDCEPYTLYSADSPKSLRYLKLSDTNLEKYPFTEAAWDFFLESKPEHTDSYTFHVKITFTDGTVLEGDAPTIKVQGKS